MEIKMAVEQVIKPRSFVDADLKLIFGLGSSLWS